MLDVILTCDTEIWCNGWERLDEQFPATFRQYIYGRTARGDYGLPYQIQVLNDHGLTAVFFVEPLFATRFGMDPLKEIVGIILSGGQRVELHLHTEWADESTVPLLPGHAGKRQHLRHFSEQEQRILIDTGMSLLTSAGGGTPKAFRAGSFGFNRDTLSALSHCGIQVDSSYNAATMGPSSGVADGILLLDTVRLGNISEYPLSVVRDGIGRIRQVSLTACSASELEDAMWSALEGRYRTFVLLFHNFDLLNQRKDHADPITVERLRRLCKFLAANRDSFRVTDFSELPENADYHQPDPLPVSRLATARRIGEQFLRRLAR